MAFAMAVNNLVEAMKKPGCPVCRINRQASERALVSFLWENVNEPDVRQGILDSYGFCPAHTRVMVAREMFTSSIPLGTNIIYEHLGRVVAKELRLLYPTGLTSSPTCPFPSLVDPFRRFIDRLRIGFMSDRAPLHPRGICPACIAGENASLNILHVLCEELQKGTDVREVYLNSDGLCFPHLRSAAEIYSRKFPGAITILIDAAITRLEDQSRDMKEYLRKNNWAYRDEKLTEAEDTAWRKTLGFFTGYPGSAFTYKTDDDIT